VWPILGLWACTGGTVTDTSTGVEPCAEPAILGLTHTPGEHMVTEARFELTLAEPGAAWLTCTLDSDTTEVHLAESSQEAEQHVLVLQGLLPGSTYTCEVTAACAQGGRASEVVVLDTDPLPEGLSELVHSRQPDLVDWNAYVLANDSRVCEGEDGAILITDDQARIRWYHRIPEDLQIDIDVHHLPGEGIYYGGGWGTLTPRAEVPGLVRTLDYSGAETSLRLAPTFGLGFNHTSEPLATGEQLSLTASEEGPDDAPWQGVGIELYDPATDTVTWSWQSQQAVDDGTLAAPESDGRNIWWANALSLVDDGQAALVTTYRSGEIWKIDRASGELVWRLGPDGDFALLTADGEPAEDADWFYIAHDPELTGDRLLVYDNGTGRPGVDFTRVVELQLDETARTARIVWEWTESGWFDPITGDADRLDNGNVLVTMGHCPCCTQHGDGLDENLSAVIEVDPDTDEVIWRQDWVDESRGVYRADKLDGCAIFANAALCPSVAARVQALE